MTTINRVDTELMKKGLQQRIFTDDLCRGEELAEGEIGPAEEYPGAEQEGLHSAREETYVSIHIM